MLLLYVAVGGAFGAVCRYLLSTWITAQLGRGFPYGTLVINLLGSFLMGMALVLAGVGVYQWRSRHEHDTERRVGKAVQGWANRHGRPRHVPVVEPPRGKAATQAPPADQRALE